MAFPLVSFRMRWMGAAAAAGALILIFVAAIAAGGAEANGQVGAELARLADERPATRTQVIVRMAPGSDPAEGRELVNAAGGSVISGDLAIINGFGAELSATAAEQLAADPRVLAVSLNGLMDVKGRGPIRGGYDGQATATTGRTATAADADAGTQSLAGYPLSRPDDVADVTEATDLLAGAQQHSVAADRVWNRTTGKGVGVAVVDTGIAGDLPDFRRNAADRRSRESSPPRSPTPAHVRRPTTTATARTSPA